MDFTKFIEEKGQNVQPVEDGWVPVDAPNITGAGTFHSELIRDEPIPLKEELSEDWQNYIDTLSAMDVADRLKAVNDYVNDAITLTPVTGDQKDISHQESWLETLGRAQGDCDDFTHVKAALLSYTGLEVHTVAAQVHYEYEDGSKTTPEAHAIAVIEHEGNFYTLDNVSSEVGRFDAAAETLETDPNLTAEFSDGHGPASLHIDEVYMVGTFSDDGLQTTVFTQEKGFASCLELKEPDADAAPLLDNPNGAPVTIKCNF